MAVRKLTDLAKAKASANATLTAISPAFPRTSARASARSAHAAALTVIACPRATAAAVSRASAKLFADCTGGKLVVLGRWVIRQSSRGVTVSPPFIWPLSRQDALDLASALFQVAN